METKHRELKQLKIKVEELLVKDEQSQSYYSEIVTILEQIKRTIRALMRTEPALYEEQLNEVERKLLSHYIKYGTFFKMSTEKNETLAINALQKAIKIDDRNPIAHYRLGFLSYKNRKYTKAAEHFEKAINEHERYKDNRYLLTKQQLYHAHLYLTNSGLNIAYKTNKKMETLDQYPFNSLQSYDVSPLFQMLNNNDNYLQRNAFYKLTREDVSQCSYDDSQEVLDNSPPNTLILHFGDRSITCKFNREDTELTQDFADTLWHMLRRCTANSPGTRVTFRDFFSSYGSDNEVNPATFRQRMSRLSRKLAGKLHIEESILQTRYRDETAYYFNENIPYIIMYRTDDVMSEEYSAM